MDNSTHIVNLYTQELEEVIKYSVTLLNQDPGRTLKSYKESNEFEKDLRLILDQSLSLSIGSFINLKDNMLNESQIIFRSSIEALVYAIYFHKFLHDNALKEYYNNPQDFLRTIKNRHNLKNSWILCLLERIKNEGGFFPKSDLEDYLEVMAKESSNFTHMNIEYLKKSRFDTTKNTFIFGQNNIEPSIKLEIISRIMLVIILIDFSVIEILGSSPNSKNSKKINKFLIYSIRKYNSLRNEIRIMTNGKA